MKNKLIIVSLMLFLAPLFWWGWNISHMLTPEDVELFFKRCPYGHFAIKKITNRQWPTPLSGATRDSAEIIFPASCIPGTYYGRYYCSKCRFICDIEGSEEMWSRDSRDLKSFEIKLSSIVTGFPTYAVVIDTMDPFGEQRWFCTIINDSIITEGTYYLSSESPKSLTDSLFDFYERKGWKLSRVFPDSNSYRITSVSADESVFIDVWHYLWRQHITTARICISRRLGRECL